MLSDAEERVLMDIEWSLRLEDRAFVRRFDLLARPARSRRWSLGARVAAALALAFLTAGLIFHSGPAAVLAPVLATVGIALWMVGRRERSRLIRSG